MDAAEVNKKMEMNRKKHHEALMDFENAKQNAYSIFNKLGKIQLLLLLDTKYKDKMLDHATIKAIVGEFVVYPPDGPTSKLAQPSA